ncbi:Hypothetical protein Tpal_303 [Trichococcus palustris]|jgi:uncharacterized protein YktA (UPF0223 family)|uniref:Uncharacterized protein n=1 Tax=Trichococcus palustris TaxID=140314 RepID=A0A143Y6Y3_9LACT|nr:UPF0223 family protein [Trichococcus palustris]CZQ82293.1 Hypothetical protein Tpal_303 [Trichococcus palustris]SFK67034.1 Uncharacterized protein YktA, UPF0223 family [Trichococcus palustris]
MQNYDYPFEVEWSQEEIVKVIKLWNAVEAAYEKGIKKAEFMRAYREFKTVLPSTGEEKKYGNMFEKESSYSLYRVLQAVKNSGKDTIFLGEDKK